MSEASALKHEIYSPEYYSLVPNLKLSLDNFSLVDVQGVAQDWNSIGKWQYENLLVNRDKLPIKTINEVTDLVKGINSLREKSKLIYEYVQNKTRYVSVQLGIGGWKPMKAEDVDRLGYGDCKALTNYTKALLSSQGIESNYSVVYAGDKKDINPDFVSMQGNHVILNIPDGDEDVWLECTSQNSPFNFIGDFTDDRNVLMIKPEGGEIKKTKKYNTEGNLLVNKVVLNLRNDKSMKAFIKRTSEGLEYGEHYNIQFLNVDKQIKNYKEEWGYINGLKIKKHAFLDDKNAVKFTEELEVESSFLLKSIGDRLLLVPNVFNRDKLMLPVYENRKHPLIIKKGSIEIDEYEINLPEGYFVKNLPEDKIIESKYGVYSYELKLINESKINLKRVLKVLEGKYSKENYLKYKEFREKISKIDQSKILLNKM